MKKIFSTAMAIAMMASMVAVSNAAVDSINTTIHTVNKDNVVSKFDKETVPYGTTILMPLVDETGKAGITEYSDVKGVSIKQSWDMNGSAIAKVEIVKKKAEDKEYYYFLGINTKDSTTTKTTDVSGKVTLKRSGTNAVAVEENLVFTLGYPTTESLDIADEYQVHTFAGNSEDMLNFNGGYYTVNTMDQGDLLLKVSTRFNSDVAAKHPEANLDFVSFNNASFNRIGELTIYAEEGSFLYVLNNDGSLTPVKASYDEYEEAFKFKTRTLGSYVVSDVELKNISAGSGNSSSTGSNSGDNNSKPNPGTGAIA